MKSNDRRYKNYRKIINLNDFFVYIGPKLASVIPSFLPEINTVQNGTELIEKESVYAFQSLKNDKSPGLEELHVTKSVYNEIKAPSMHVFRNSIDHFPKT